MKDKLTYDEILNLDPESLREELSKHEYPIFRFRKMKILDRFTEIRTMLYRQDKRQRKLEGYDKWRSEAFK